MDALAQYETLFADTRVRALLSEMIAAFRQIDVEKSSLQTHATLSALLRPTTPTNTPAARKIRIIVMIFLSPTPFAMTSSLSSNDSARFCRQATRIAARNATTIGML